MPAFCSACANGTSAKVLLADRLVVEDRAADGLRQARRVDDHVAVGAPHLGRLRDAQRGEALVGGGVALVHRQQALAVGGEGGGGGLQCLFVHLVAPGSRQCPPQWKDPARAGRSQLDLAAIRAPVRLPCGGLAGSAVGHGACRQPGCPRLAIDSSVRDDRATQLRKTAVQLGMIGLGRMGANMARRVMRQGHQCVVQDANADAVAKMVADGAVGAATLAGDGRAR